MIVREGEGHKLVERELPFPVAGHERGAHSRELEALPHHSGSDAKTRSDFFDPEAAIIDEPLEGLELIRRVHVRDLRRLCVAELHCSQLEDCAA